MLARLLLAVRTSLAALLSRAPRWMPGVRRPLPPSAPPAAGVYRARPDIPELPPTPPPPPAPPPPRRADPRREPLVHALGATLVAAAGLLVAIFPPRAEHRFWGVLGAAMFGVAAWVFWEQVAAGLGTAPLLPRARQRALVVTGLGGLAAMAVSVAWERVAPFDRLVTAVVGLLLVLPSMVALWKTLRAGRASRPAHVAPRRRVAEERRPPSFVASHTLHVSPPPPAPDLRAARRRWKRRG